MLLLSDVIFLLLLQSYILHKKNHVNLLSHFYLVRMLHDTFHLYGTYSYSTTSTSTYYLCLLYDLQPLETT